MFQQGQLANQRYSADQGLAAAQASASAASASAAAQERLGMARLGLDQQAQDWSQFTQGQFLPYQLQNMQMQGMYPTGMPNAPGFANAPQIPGGNQYPASLSQGAQDQNYWNALGSFGGSLFNNIPWGSIF